MEIEIGPLAPLELKESMDLCLEGRQSPRGISSRFLLEAAHNPGAGVAAVEARASFLPPCSGVRH